MHLRRNVRKRGLNPAWWSSVARDAVWRARYPAYENPEPPTWPLPPDLRPRVEVRWPAEYRWEGTGRWVETIRQGLAAQVPTLVGPVVQRYHGHVLFEVRLDDRVIEAVIDWRDTDEIVDDVADDGLTLFKMQHRTEGYDRDNVVAGGFVPADPKIYRYLTPLRRHRDRVPPRGVHGRFAPNSDIRARAMTLLQQQTRFPFVVAQKQPYTTYLHETAGAAVCIDLPGGGDLCYRLIDYLAIGACVVRPRGAVGLHVPLVDDVDVVLCEEDLSDLVEICAELLRDEGRRARIADGAQQYFDRYLAREQLAGYYLTTVLRHAKVAA
jgi:hypothetical protein